MASRLGRSRRQYRRAREPPGGPTACLARWQVVTRPKAATDSGRWRPSRLGSCGIGRRQERVGCGLGRSGQRRGRAVSRQGMMLRAALSYVAAGRPVMHRAMPAEQTRRSRDRV